MRAIQYQQTGSYDQLKLVELPRPEPTDGQVLVQISVASVSPLDNTVRAGHLPASRRKPLPLVPGVGGVGHVVEPGTSGLTAGRGVVLTGSGYGVLRDGTWQEYLTAPASHLLPIPDGVTDEAVAALDAGAGHLTAYLALTELAAFKAGQTVFSPGIGGAVGMGTTQIARVLGAGRAISTASTTEKVEQARAAGYADVIDLSRETVRDGIARLTDGRGVDVVIDGVGGPVTGEAIASLAPGGTLVSVGYSGGTQASINVTDLIWKTATVKGFMFSLFTPETVVAGKRTLIELLQQGRLDPIVAKTFPLEQAAEAQRYLIEDRPFGRVLLRI